MRRWLLILAVLVASTAPASASASATTKREAAKLVAAKLRQYGTVKPECARPQPTGWVCLVQFERAGTWYSVYATVNGRRAKIDRPIRRWRRAWAESPATCTRARPKVPGRLSSNDGICYSVTLAQNFATVRGSLVFDEIRPSVMIFGTGTGAFPRFYSFRCTYINAVYECLNHFGDGFRWVPVDVFTEIWTRWGRCGIIESRDLLLCRSGEQTATLKPDGTMCGGPSCFPPSDFGDWRAEFTPGQTIAMGPYSCLVLEGGVQCTVNGKGLTITPTGVTPVGP